MRERGRRLLGLVCLLVSSRCALFEHLFQSAFEKPRLTFRGLEPRRATLAELELDVVLEVENPNSVGVSVARGDLTLSLEGKRLATLTPSPVSVPSHARALVRIPARARYLDLMAGALSFHHQASAHYKVEGSVGLDTPIGVIDLPVSQEGDLPLPALPDAEVKSVRATRADLTGVALEVVLALHNPNPVPLWVDALGGKLFVASAEVATLSSPDLGELGPGATRELTLPVEVSLASAPALLVALAHGDAQVHFEGTLRSGEASVPLSLDTVLKRH